MVHLTTDKWTWQDVADSIHRHPKRVILSYRSEVFDVTDFVSRHPGGSDVFEVGAGRDITHVFDAYHPLSVATTILPKYKIGDLISHELPVFPDDAVLYPTLRSRVDGIAKKRDLKAPNWLTYGFIYACVAIGYFGSTYIAESWWVSIMASVVMGLGCAWIGLHPMHDASHFSATHKPWVWRLLGATHDFINGASYLVWVYQHAFGHHPYTNLPDADPDIVTAEKDIRRIKPYQRWWRWHWNQAFIVPFMYGFLAVKTRLQDVLILYIAKKNGSIRVNPPSFSHALQFWGGKGFYVFYRFILPVLVGCDWRRVLTVNIISDLVTSYWLAFSFQLNHVAEGVEFPTKPELEWAKHQVVTTQDYAVDSLLTTMLVGALNLQTVHHLFPGVHQRHYRSLVGLLKDECKRSGVTYRSRRGFTEAFASHWNWLFALGRNIPKAE